RGRSPRAPRTARRLARLRRPLGALLLVGPLLLVVGIDAARRGERLLTFDGYHRSTYAAAALESLVVWGTLLYAACRRGGRGRTPLGVLFVAGLALTLGGQRYFHDQYHAYLNVDVSLFASNLMDSVVNQLFADIGNFLLAKVLPTSVAVALLLTARRVLRPRRTPARVASALAPALVVASFFIPTQHRHIQAATPDVLYLHAVGGLVRTQLGFTDESRKLRPRARESLPVHLQLPAPERKPNVVLVILESVRADAVCSEYDPDCRRTPYSNGAVPDRFPLLQMRSMASTTAISLAVLWSGLLPNASRDDLHTSPLLFDYARARGYDTAFYTSQNMMFGNARLWVKNLGVSEFVSATDLDPTCDLDMGAPEGLLADHVTARLGELKEPFLAVIQLSNVHFPYLVDPAGPRPFQPDSTSKAAEDGGAFFNYYQNAVHQQDQHIGRIVRHVRENAFGPRTVLVTTSDHGEAFREHNQMGHTFSVLDEEIHVPAWIDAPPGVLLPEERAALRAHRDRPVFHIDVPATILDLIGVWNDPGIARFRTALRGESLLDPPGPERALPLTNCAGVWSCAFENWGVMRGTLKVEARSWDPSWHCFDVASDPGEALHLDSAACKELEAAALDTFGRLPGRRDD
ncbi:MAG: sulfatase-like hydrolase/transferase, partial [Deltaproteobacteria bacterium]|nr:sulfatase-like hydrolase/transferase [Deltaproteobacteria bacterium]